MDSSLDLLSDAFGDSSSLMLALLVFLAAGTLTFASWRRCACGAK